MNAEYKGFHMGLGFRMDFLVEEIVIIELKSVEALHPVFWKTSLTYLKQSKKKLAYLVNFNVEKLIDKESLIRIIN